MRLSSRLLRMDLATKPPTSICVAALAESAAFYREEVTAAILWHNVRALALDSANPKRTTTYPFTISFVSTVTGDHMGDIEFEYEAESNAYVRELLDDMESGNIEGFPGTAVPVAPIPTTVRR